MSKGLPSEFFERLVAESPDGVIYGDIAGFIRYWNAAATRIFGFAEGEAVGARLDLIIPERLRSRHWEGTTRSSMVPKATMAAAPSSRCRPCTRTVDRLRSSLRFCRFVAMPGLF
jgi:PAS domain-containing protein